MSRRRVVVTGLGMLSPLGGNVKDTWEGILAGKSGIGMIEHFDASPFNTQFCGRVKGFEATDYIDRKDTKKMDMFIQYGIAAAIQAVEDSGLEVTAENAGRIGCSIGSGIGGLETIERNHTTLEKSGPRRISPFFIPAAIINMIAGNLSIRYGLKGPNIAITTACTTGSHSIGYAARTIAYGDADAMVAGGAEYASTPLGIGGFSAARALSSRNDNPQGASRPWDRDRDGFVLADGAGVVVLEEYERAKARGAKIYAELTGFGMSGDAYHMTSPPEDGAGAAASMQNAVNDAGLNATDIDYINAHGTSTPNGDRAESQAAKSLYGADYKQIRMSSTKSMIGHLLGAAGAVEAIFSVLAIRDQVAPPTINLENPDEGCDLDYISGSARDMPIRHAMSNSFGFGGTNGTLVFSKLDD
ncbi:beta-ketoacyl-[acyl-carrier-protein] synthase II [Natronospirillum operosum]|uniref:3-oxoacyl-[acyl-carrier-protein] synthase 2 n=1 Tax=Natronospirillum operosum TaxID=2759953 RepID=A0A4Z0WK75_9GAMM|nr:beta-ketoacyl-ACP synthase II [Natronospirillum operosum]TGG95625.1 beta-ketoacyl-[acyl-carrier-protein] synthase II [Natronospirillum operosum]